MSSQSSPQYVIGPSGAPLTIADLPRPGMNRWVIRRKAEVIAAVRGGLLSLEEACGRYMLTVDEFLSWQYLIDQHGPAGLRTTRIKQYRLPGINIPASTAAPLPEVDIGSHALRYRGGDPNNVLS